MREIEQIKVSSLRAYENNPRSNVQAVDIVKKSIQEFGFTNPILVDENNVIIAGHTRFQASKELGLEYAPVIVINDLTDEQVKAYRIMDNKSGEFAEWDYAKLLGEIDMLEDYDITLTGFDEIDLEKLKIEIEVDDLNLDVGGVPLEREVSEEKAKSSPRLMFGKNQMRLSEEELKMLNDKYDEYLNEVGYSYGFVYYLLGVE